MSADKPVQFGSLRRDYDTVTSTQDIAREWAQEKELRATGAVVTAQAMTAGRGRLGRAWHVPPGRNVCFTAIGPPVDAARAWEIALIGGFAATVGATPSGSVTPLLRFPNDVYVAGRKLGGVLVETLPAPVSGQVIPLVGIGINVNVERDEFPAELRDRATSLSAEIGRPVTVSNIETNILKYLTVFWGMWQKTGLRPLLAQWCNIADPDARRAFVINGEEVSCRVLTVEENGNVTLETPTGETVIVPAPQIIFGSD